MPFVPKKKYVQMRNELERCTKAEKLNRDLEEERRKINERLEWLSEFSSNQLVKIEKDKYDNTVLITSDGLLSSKPYSGMNITLYDLWSRDHLCRLDGHIEAGKSARLEDITGEKNRGYGSMAVEYFLLLCEKHGAKQVSGRLSWVDRKHFDRSEHFYKKFGFEVHFNESRTAGKIQLKL